MVCIVHRLKYPFVQDENTHMVLVFCIAHELLLTLIHIKLMLCVHKKKTILQTLWHKQLLENEGFSDNIRNAGSPFHHVFYVEFIIYMKSFEPTTTKHLHA